MASLKSIDLKLRLYGLQHPSKSDLQNSEETHNNTQSKKLPNQQPRCQTQTFWSINLRLFFILLITATNILLSLEENVVIPQSDVFTCTSIMAWYILTLVKTCVF